MSSYSARKSDQPGEDTILTIDGSDFPIDAVRFMDLYNRLPLMVAQAEYRQRPTVSIWLDDSWRKIPTNHANSISKDLHRILAEDIASQIDQF